MNKENLFALLYDFEKVAEFFKHDGDKALLWFTTKNPYLGECEPITFYERDRGHKVTAFIDSKLKGE